MRSKSPAPVFQQNDASTQTIRVSITYFRWKHNFQGCVASKVTDLTQLVICFSEATERAVHKENPHNLFQRKESVTNFVILASVLKIKDEMHTRVYPKVSGLAASSDNCKRYSSATRCSRIAILWVSPVSFAAITLCVAFQWVFIVVVYFVIDSVRKLLDTPSCTSLQTRSGHSQHATLASNYESRKRILKLTLYSKEERCVRTLWSSCTWPWY
jgi:uncharacterized membrane protein